MAANWESQQAAEALRRYQPLAERLRQDGEALTHAEAVAALEAAAVIVENSLRPVPEIAEAELLALTQRVSGLKPGESQARQRWVYRQDALVSRRISLMGGVSAALTADYQLVALEIDPADARRVERALRFVGTALDVPDAAENHDYYSGL